MWLWRAALWKQLATVWGGALALVVLLCWLQLRRLGGFFWLIPYPDWRLIRPSVVVSVFRRYPLLGVALVGVPVLTVLVTIALGAGHLVSTVGRPSGAR